VSTWAWVAVGAGAAFVLLAVLVVLALCAVAAAADELSERIHDGVMAEQATRPHGNVYVLHRKDHHDAA